MILPILPDNPTSCDASVALSVSMHDSEHHISEGLPPRARLPLQRYGDWVQFDDLRVLQLDLQHVLQVAVTPLKNLLPMRSPEADQWKAAIQTEYESLMQNNTWRLAPLPKGKKTMTVNGFMM